MRGLILLLAGCAVTYTGTSGGPCIERVRYGKSVHFKRNGEDISRARLENFLELDPAERHTVQQARHTRRAGWSLAAIGFSMELAGLAVLLGATDTLGALPIWAQALGGSLVANWFPTVISGIALTAVAESELTDAVNRKNQRGPCP